MPAEVRPPLTVAFSLPGGVAYDRRLDDLPNQMLAADLARALVATTHPHGPIRTQSVAMQYVQTMRRMTRELHNDGFGGGIAELTPALIVQYWLTCDFHRERRIRAVLAAHAASGGTIHAGIRAHLAGRRINAIKPSRPIRPTATPSGAGSAPPARSPCPPPMPHTDAPAMQPSAEVILVSTA